MTGAQVLGVGGVLASCTLIAAGFELLEHRRHQLVSLAGLLMLTANILAICIG
jgi:hypothetical protein